ncbi:MAG: hypothetical protein BGO31_19590 [Bacteroidetes bacterium 43-16]|nr:MAG: hypothetical protein BGO31_19590 [Bacteroidetes bacterium 43-16]
MNIKNPFFKTFVFYTLIPIALFTLFKNTLDEGILKYFADSIFAACYPSNICYDIAVALLLVIAIISTMQKVLNKGKVPYRLFFICITSLIIYSTYRLLFTRAFYYTETAVYTQLKLADIVFLYPITIIFTFLLQNVVKMNLKPKLIETDGFTVDEPITIKEKNDLLNRNKFIDVIANRIKSTKTGNSSFAIGIVAKWGYGKTTFINTLLDKFDEDDAIKIELNVWKCNNNTQIIETLFKELRKSLKPYSFTIDNKLEEYAVNLIKGTKSEHFNMFKNVLGLLVKDVSLAGQYDSINKEIKRINKRIIVVFDDLDRLDKKEIYEVIRLIRNTANFGNTFFIAAYDRTYILNAIQDINSYQTHYFLEKIFQLEFTLPPINDSILEQELERRLYNKLTEQDKLGYKKLKERGVLYPEIGNADLTSLFIHSIRDVVRFANSFRLSYEFVKEEVYFPDFFCLELIKYKHPEIFEIIYKEKDKFFTTKDADSLLGITSEYTYYLKRSDEKEGKGGKLLLKEYLENDRGGFKLESEDVDRICLAYDSIFAKDATWSLSQRRAILNEHLTVQIPSMFDRYFILGIEGRLSEIKFSKVRQLHLDEFLKEIETLVSIEDMKFELRKRFELITQFDGRDDFEKILSGIFYVGNLKRKHLFSLNYKYVGFDNRKIAALIGDDFYSKFYNDSKSYKEFITALFTTSIVGEYDYTNQFLAFILKDGYYSVMNVLNDVEISNIFFLNFQNIINTSKAFSRDIWWHYLDCIKSSNKNTGRYKRMNDTRKLLKSFVWKNDLDNFIDYTISKFSFESHYEINTIISDIFGTNQLFIRAIKLTKRNSPKIHEFLRLYEILNMNPDYSKGVPKDFFKEIKLKWESENNE